MVDLVRYESLTMCAIERQDVWGTSPSAKYGRAFSHPSQATNREAS